MRRHLFTLLAVFACAAPATAQSYDFGVFGDMPYVSDALSRAIYLPQYAKVLESLSTSNAEFVVHVGDYTTGPFCGDSVVYERHREFQNVSRPFVFVFGDNDWTDCGRGGFDPIERLQKLRAVFTQGSTSLGKTTIPLVRQSDVMWQFSDYRENVLWTHGREMFVALNLPGSRNNWGRDTLQASAEYVERNAANLAFLRDAFARSLRDDLRGIVIFIQGNPGLNTLPEHRDARQTLGFNALLTELQQLAVNFGKPVALIHGDTHYFRIDKPLVDMAGHAIPNFTRVEVFGHPNYYWLRVHVDPADPDLFSFRLVRPR